MGFDELNVGIWTNMGRNTINFHESRFELGRNHVGLMGNVRAF